MLAADARSLDKAWQNIAGQMGVPQARSRSTTRARPAHASSVDAIADALTANVEPAGLAR
jgi:hypothetical protein